MWQYNNTDELYHFGVPGMKWGKRKLNKAQSKINTASMDRISAKAKHNAARQKTPGKAAKAEFNTYRKEMQKTGIRGSALDVGSGSRSTNIYNHIKAQKGKAYADKIEKKVQNRAYTAMATSAAVAAGSMAVSAYLGSR